MDIDYPYPPGSRLAAYFRDSGGVSQEASVAQQEVEVRRWAAERGYELPEELIFRDIRKSSKNGTVGRKAFLAMTEYFAGGTKTAGLLLWDLTRWGREFKSSLRWFLDIDMRGVKIYTVSEPIPEGPFGIIWVILKLMAAEEENKRKGRDIKRALRQLHEDHGAHVGAIPFGYRPVYEQIGVQRDGSPRLARHLEPDPENAPIVRELYRLRAAGYSIPEIRRKVGMKKGFSSYQHILYNPAYAGRYQWGDLVSDDVYPQIVDIETWERVQAINAGWKERQARHPRRETSPYLLSGLVRCGVCGMRMIGKSTQPAPGYKYFFYQCSPIFHNDREPCSPARLIRAHLVDDRVMARLKEIMTTPEILADLHTRMLARQPGQMAERSDKLATELARVRREIANITAAIADGAYTRALAKRQAELENQEAELEARIKKTPARRATVPETIDAGKLAALSAEAWLAIEVAEHRDRQLFVRAVVKWISVIKSDNGQITGEIELQELPGLGDVSGLILPL